MDHGLKNAEDSHRLSDASRNISDSNEQGFKSRSRLPEQDINISNINLHDKDNVINLFEDKLETKVANVAITLSMSSVTGLADLVEDEIIPKPIPMQVYIFGLLCVFSEHHNCFLF